MSSPAEKALYLFNKMNGFRISYAHRVKCAKVLVDEMINTTELYAEVNYWQGVRVELDKLAVKK